MADEIPIGVVELEVRRTVEQAADSGAVEDDDTRVRRTGRSSPAPEVRRQVGPLQGASRVPAPGSAGSGAANGNGASIVDGALARSHLGTEPPSPPAFSQSVTVAS